MTRRCLILVVIPAVFVIAGAGAWVIRPRVPCITPENVDRIKLGMTLTKVESILGGPARDETTGPVVCVVGPTGTWYAAPGVAIHGFVDKGEAGNVLGGQLPSGVHPPWVSDTVAVWVRLDADAQVTSCCHVWLERRQEGFIDLCRRWLGL